MLCFVFIELLIFLAYIANMPIKRTFSAFDRIQHLESEDKAAEKLRRKQNVKDVAKAKAARSQTKTFGHLMESRILLQRTFQQIADAEDNDLLDDRRHDNRKPLVDSCNELLNQLLEARRKLQGLNHPEKENNDNSDELLESEYAVCRDNWKEVLNRRHQDLRLHAGLASTSKTQFRILDSSFWQQVESTVAHEKMRQRVAGDASLRIDFDDAKVYSQMLKDFLVAAANNPEDGGTDQSTALKRWKSPSTKKQVDRKASKGRKIRYVEIPKLVNFTFPVSRESKSSLNEDEWFQSLFGGAAYGKVWIENSGPN